VTHQTLVERYTPSRIDQFVGLAEPKAVFRAFLRAPRAQPLLLVGSPGTGKTTLAMAFARQLPGSLVHVPAQKCDAATLNDIADKLAYYPATGSWWVVLIDEIDRATEGAQLQLLSRLDATASLKPAFGGGMEVGRTPQVLWIFSCNGEGDDGTITPRTLEKRFVSRCGVLRFTRPSIAELRGYYEAIWDEEGGNGAPDGYFSRLAMLAVREALNHMELDLLVGGAGVTR
jgi:DNA polymerase III delta prime subunit